MSDTFRITLRDMDGLEGFDTREFDLALGAKFPVGRASRNTTKRDLVPASTNAFIDSPVISREHAVLSANADSGIPHVFITDTGSMHGTTVNGQRLASHTPKQLASGDKLQFGIDVNRNEEFFVARKYHFEARLVRPQAPFSLGFTVPDSDEEEVGDSESDVSDNDHADTTVMGQGFIIVDDGDDDDNNNDNDDDKHHVVAEVRLQNNVLHGDTPVVVDAAIADEYGSESEASEGNYSSDVQDDDLNSEASVMGGSEPDYNSDHQVPDSQIAATTTSDEAARQPEAEPERSEASMYPWEVDVTRSLPPIDVVTVTDTVFADSFPPPLPPRPSAAQPSRFDRAELPPSNRCAWFSDEMPCYPSYMGTNHGDRPVLFSPASVSGDVTLQGTKGSSFGTNFTDCPVFTTDNAVFTNDCIVPDGMHTPPAMHPSDVTASSTPPPSRRTKVSIGEIVEEQPLTPTSVNNMKRKADVLDDSEASITDLSTRSESLDSAPTHYSDDEPTQHLQSEPSDVQQTVAQTAAETAAIIAQRPKKQPRSILGKVRTTATYLGVGAAGAAGMVALLSSLPDAFFA